MALFQTSGQEIMQVLARRRCDQGRRRGGKAGWGKQVPITHEVKIDESNHG